MGLLIQLPTGTHVDTDDVSVVTVGAAAGPDATARPTLGVVLRHREHPLVVAYDTRAEAEAARDAFAARVNEARKKMNCRCHAYHDDDPSHV